MPNNHTLEQLQAMPALELAAIAARLRGYRDGVLNGQPAWIASAPNEPVQCGILHADWNPAEDDRQAMGLLRWLGEQGGDFNILYVHRREGIVSHVSAQTGEGLNYVRVPGNNARAMTIAFVLAMEAMQ